MVDAKHIEEDEKKVAKLVDEFNLRLSAEIKGRPYLLVLTTLYEIERRGNTSKLAAQWNWRSNVDSRAEGRKQEEIEAGRKMMRLLVDQLSEVADKPEGGIRSRYRI